MAIPPTTKHLENELQNIHADLVKVNHELKKLFDGQLCETVEEKVGSHVRSNRPIPETKRIAGELAAALHEGHRRVTAALDEARAATRKMTEAVDDTQARVSGWNGIPLR